jgi:hypothetical protein
MPYITQNERQRLDPAIDKLIDELRPGFFSPGQINYVFTRIINQWFTVSHSYNTINAIMGVLSCVASEFYRRRAVPYEEIKQLEHGDVT